jgi:hypothetical protein
MIELERLFTAIDRLLPANAWPLRFHARRGKHRVYA